MSDIPAFYPIGTPGTPWGDAERDAWRAGQQVKRSYRDDVLAVVERLRDRFNVRQYGELLLARYAHVRDVVVPQWRRAVEIALTQDEDGDTQAAELLREALESLLQATAPEPAVFPSGKDLRV